MKRKLQEALWSDCESDAERVNFILAGRAHETGVISKAIQHEVAMAFHFRDQSNTNIAALKDKIANVVDNPRVSRREFGWIQKKDFYQAIDDWARGE